MRSFGYTSVKVKGDTATVDVNRGALADAAAQLFRAYEMLIERKYLEAGLKTADFFLQVQQPCDRKSLQSNNFRICHLSSRHTPCADRSSITTKNGDKSQVTPSL